MELHLWAAGVAVLLAARAGCAGSSPRASRPSSSTPFEPDQSPTPDASFASRPSPVPPALHPPYPYRWTRRRSWPPGCARRGAWHYCRTGSRWSASGTRAGCCASPSPEGRLAPDNAFPASLAFTTGHRNVQGLTFDRSGRLFATEHGQHAFDEVNVLEAGNVYGRPRVEGDAPVSGATRPVLTGTPDEASPSRAVIARCSLGAAALRGNRL
jgi:hypothetical protein